jgi:hypothetical protein
MIAVMEYLGNAHRLIPFVPIRSVMNQIHSVLLLV